VRKSAWTNKTETDLPLQAETSALAFIDVASQLFAAAFVPFHVLIVFLLVGRRNDVVKREQWNVTLRGGEFAFRFWW